MCDHVFVSGTRTYGRTDYDQEETEYVRPVVQTDTTEIEPAPGPGRPEDTLRAVDAPDTRPRPGDDADLGRVSLDAPRRGLALGVVHTPPYATDPYRGYTHPLIVHGQQNVPKLSPLLAATKTHGPTH